MTNRFSSLVAAAVVAALQSSAAQATLVFSEDFTGLSNSTALTTANTDLTYIRIGSGGGVINAVDPGSFGSGPSAIVTQSTSSGSLNGIGVASTLPSSNIYSLTMDLRLTDLTGDVVIGVGSGSAFTGNSTFSTSQGLFWLQSDSGNFERRTSSAWEDVGGGTSLTLNTNYSLAVIANGSSVSLPYTGGTLAANTMDIYLNGNLVDDDAPVTTNGLSANAFRVYQISLGNFEVDNIQLFNSAVAVPEPSTVALGGIGLAIAAAAARRRQRVRPSQAGDAATGQN
jgi:hypothetical protein